jgi:sugar phosphate isomerase/epimerase
MEISPIILENLPLGMKEQEGNNITTEHPRLACCNFISDVNSLKEFALKHGFQGIDWSFFPDNIPRSPAAETALIKAVSTLYPLEVRYHCAFGRMDLGDVDQEAAQQAMVVLRRVCRLVSKLGGHFLTIHVGLGRDTTVDLSWNRTLAGLADLVRFASNLRVRLCLENLAWGWSSRPELFEKMIRKSGAWVTFDIGHARVSPSIESYHYHVEDFVAPHPERVLHAHIYHVENETGHIPPQKVTDLEERLQLLRTLSSCNWWVLELREEQALLDTLKVIRDFLTMPANQNNRQNLKISV